MGKLTSLVRERSTLDDGDVAAMNRLFDLYYEGGAPHQFAQDLGGKTHVIELREGDDLRGFSTLCVYDLEALTGLSGPLRVIYSGDTIIDHAYWGEQALASAFCRFAGTAKAAAPHRPLYWLLISKGHRTYRYLHLFARRYHPSPEGDEGGELVRLAAAIADQRFAQAYDRQSGLVRFSEAATRLRAAWHDQRDAVRRSAVVSYFLQRNPGHAQGDELVCLCELEEGNLRSFALKAFREGLNGA